MDATKGIFSTSQTNDGSLMAGSGAGTYQVVQEGFGITALAGKTFTVNGFGSCTDGARRYAFQQVEGDALAYGWTCPGGYVDGAGPVSGSATGASVADTALPGVVVLTDEGSTDPLYVGISVDGTTDTTGIAMVARVGNAGSGCSFDSPANCRGLRQVARLQPALSRLDGRSLRRPARGRRFERGAGPHAVTQARCCWIRRYRIPITATSAAR